MKVRIKFSKEGSLKFIGHLDTMRYFQKALRRAKLPVAYSEGFSPHIIMSFAAPLGVGITSSGEYFDVQFTQEMSTTEISQRLNATMAEGIRVICTRKVEDGKASKAMSLVEAADYLVTFHSGKEPEMDWKRQVETFCGQEQILVTKKTKRSEKEVDIRPIIYEMIVEDDVIFLRLAAARRNYTKPELVMDTFLKSLGILPNPFSYQVHRCEIYADRSESSECHLFVPLADLGEEIE